MQGLPLSENARLASRTPSRRAVIQLRRAQPQMAVRPQATSDRQGALPVRGSSAAYVEAKGAAAGRRRAVSLLLKALGLPSPGEIGRPGNYSPRRGLGWPGLYCRK